MIKNLLSEEKSPYLLQHKDNPVWWHPWGEEAFERAIREDKPVFLSIGYATCYWCHVMERDSFEVQEVAQILNERFVAIKLDREERPDLDAIYMDAVIAMTGHGGWPMSVFLTPQKIPFYGGTFFYQAQFIQILEKLSHLWVAEREKIANSAQHIEQFLLSRNEGEKTRVGDGVSRVTLEDRTCSALTSSFDREYGGFGRAPKFPPTGQLGFLLRQGILQGNSALLAMAEKTYIGMAKGGIFDQIGGGFSRYSTDAEWLVPHFEKMLYDNALMAIGYLDCARATAKREYLEIATSTLNFILDEMTADIGAFASALDAGEVGREGEYYVWAYREIEALLAPEEFALLREVFSLTPEGNFEAKHMILALNHEVPLSVREQSLFVTARAKLHARRNLRQRPLCDDKVLTGWNGLAISALAQGYQATGEQRYLSAATRAASWIFDTMWSSDGKLKRRYRDGEVRFDGCLEDYAYLIAGLLDLGIASRDYRWFSKARDIQRAQDYLLWSAEKSSYRTSIGADLVAQIEELADGALPSPNAIALSNLMRLSHAWIDLEFSERATALGQRIGQAAEKYPESYCRALVALNYQESSQQVVIVIPKNKLLTRTLCDQIKNAFIPGIDLFVVQEGQAIEPLPILEGKPSLNGEVTAYVCSAQRCEPATNEIEALLRRP